LIAKIWISNFQEVGRRGRR